MTIAAAQVFVAVETWGKIAACKMKPSLALQLSRYVKKVSDEFALVQARRNELIVAHGEKNDDGQVSVSPTSPGWTAFLSDMNELMSAPTELEPFPVPLDTLVEEIGKFEGNAWTAADCAVMEPFFAV